MFRLKPRSHKDYSARVEAVWQNETGTSCVSRGKLEDLSDGGLSIRIPDPILVGSKLIARMPLGNFSGTVVQSRRFGQDYVLGVRRDVQQKPVGE
jgi:hypothetical protein